MGSETWLAPELILQHAPELVCLRRRELACRGDVRCDFAAVTSKQLFEGANDVGKSEEAPFLREQQHELAGEIAGAGLGQYGLHPSGLFFAREERRAHKAGEFRTLLKQSFDLREICSELVDGAFFRRQLESRSRVAQSQTGAMAVFGGHVLPYSDGASPGFCRLSHCF